jgi:DNA helicase HerA-like ATPase
MRARTGSKSKYVGEIGEPSTTYDVDILLYGRSVNEGDFLFAFDEDRHKVVMRVTSIAAEHEDEYWAKSEVLGYIENATMAIKRFPLKPETKVMQFAPEEVSRLLKMDEGMFVGFFVDTQVPVRMSFPRISKGHTVIFGRTGSGKSWTVGVCLEEVCKLHVPVVVIDPHGEYETLSSPYPSSGWKTMKAQGLKPRHFPTRVIRVNPEKPTVGEVFIRVFASEDGKTDFALVRKQAFVSYANGSLQNSSFIKFDSTMLMHYAKLVKPIDKKLKIGSDYNSDIRRLGPNDYAVRLAETMANVSELVQPDKVNIITLRDIDPESSRVLVGIIVEDLFKARKKDLVPPFICVIEEAHIFAPSVSNEVSKPTLETLAKEGRKFGMPTWFVSQRPQLLSTTIRANCENFIIQRITHPSDQQAIIGACEGLDSDAIKTLKNLPVGTAMITGTVVDFPIVVKVRHRQTAHSFESGFEEKLRSWKNGGEAQISD